MGSFVAMVLLTGPPGPGKPMLAQSFAGLLPPMSTYEALQSAAIASPGGRFALAQWGQRPTGHPHHTASAAVRQGVANLALQGKAPERHLFLDEVAAKFLNVAATRLGWSARGTHHRHWRVNGSRMWPRSCSNGGLCARPRLGNHVLRAF